MTWFASASVCRSRNANAISQSARWQMISRAFHFPGAGRHSRLDPVDSLFTISERRRDVSSMTSIGLCAPRSDSYGLAATADDYKGGLHAKVGQIKHLCR